MWTSIGMTDSASSLISYMNMHQLRSLLSFVCTELCHSMEACYTESYGDDIRSTCNVEERYVFCKYKFISFQSRSINWLSEMLRYFSVVGIRKFAFYSTKPTTTRACIGFETCVTYTFTSRNICFYCTN